MELFYTLTSPYSRKILVLADHLGLSNQITMTFMHPLEDQSGRLSKANPLEKIPTLILDTGDVVYDSPLVAEALFYIADVALPPFDLRLKQLKMQALADGIMDAAVSVQEERCRTDAEQSKFWVSRRLGAILRSVKEFDSSMIDDAQDWHIGSISMACALDYLCFRHPDLNWQKENPMAYDWYINILKKDIMKSTDPRQG